MRLNQSFFPIQFSICFSPKIFILIFRSIRFDSRPQFNFNQTNRLQQQKKYQTVYRITKIPKYLKKNHKYRKKKHYFQTWQTETVKTRIRTSRAAINWPCHAYPSVPTPRRSIAPNWPKPSLILSNSIRIRFVYSWTICTQAPVL